MTPEESADLIMFAEHVYQNLVNVICVCVIYGLYMLSFLTALYIFRSPIKAQTKALLIFLGLAFFSITLDWIGRTDSPLLIIHLAFIHPINTTNLSTNLGNAQNSLLTLTFGAFALWGPPINLLIGDGLVLWRAWAIWNVQNRRKRSLLKFVLIFLMVGNAALLIAAASINTHIGPSLSSAVNSLDWVPLVVSLNSQYVCDFLGWAESMMLCAVLNGVDIGNENLLSPISLVFSMIIAVGNGCAALYPISLIILVHMEASPLISFLPSESGARPEFSTVDNEIEMQDMTATS
ncbi:hypothetical protein BT96DRAFT_1017853 [Gymnopus androsaceus JB14]|uniref:Uncharacterized protein n=1 Tax=Gymnopus androsaceus JB14 TaxID=1447944 RepID=A0A6A4HSA0_9AGAR|nr:hypothetical protein BT96DRAFT_1017853 [Gymnopus androsaceus JB14]